MKEGGSAMSGRDCCESNDPADTVRLIFCRVNECSYGRDCLKSVQHGRKKARAQGEEENVGRRKAQRV